MEKTVEQLAEEYIKLLDQTKDSCFECEGTGYIGGVGINDLCTNCNGTGKVGEWHPDRLVNVRKGDIYWTREQLSAPDWAKDYYKE